MASHLKKKKKKIKEMSHATFVKTKQNYLSFFFFGNYDSTNTNDTITNC